MKRFSTPHIILCVAFVAFISRPTGAGFIADLLVFAFLTLVGCGAATMIRAVIRALRPVKE